MHNCLFLPVILISHSPPPLRAGKLLDTQSHDQQSLQVPASVRAVLGGAKGGDTPCCAPLCHTACHQPHHLLRQRAVLWAQQDPQALCHLQLGLSGQGLTLKHCAKPLLFRMAEAAEFSLTSLLYPQHHNVPTQDILVWDQGSPVSH